MFYLRKGKTLQLTIGSFKTILVGCQDPWNVNQDVKLPICQNITQILESYGRENFTWDEKFWDRPYMGERELSDLERNNMKCKTPCDQMVFSADINYKAKDR